MFCDRGGAVVESRKRGIRMQDRYLFKAKRKDNGEWVEGFYFCMTHTDGRHTHHFIIPCKRKNRNCRYVYNQNSYQCKKCIEENLNQYPITCEDCHYGGWGICNKRGKNQRRMRPCEDFKWS